MKKWTRAEHLPTDEFPVWMPEHGPLVGVLMLRVEGGLLVLSTEKSGKAETPWEEHTVSPIVPAMVVFADYNEDVRVNSGLVEILLERKDDATTLYQRPISIQGPEEEAEPDIEPAIAERQAEEAPPKPVVTAPIVAEGEQVIQVEGGEVIIPAKAAEPITVTKEEVSDGPPG